MESKTALLVMDVQNAITKSLKEPDMFFAALVPAIQKARSAGIPVIYVVVGFRSGYPEVSPANQFFTVLKSGARQLDTAESMQVDARVAPQPGELLVIKKRVSAFTGSDLEVVLRSMEIKHIVLTGISTSGVVLSTLREAADKDYRITVLQDCCADADEEIHRVLTTKIFARQATVVNAEGWKV